jgi:hypothetical protein
VLTASIVRAMMEAASTSETSLNFYQTTQHYNPEDSHLQDIYYKRILFCSLFLVPVQAIWYIFIYFF